MLFRCVAKFIKCIDSCYKFSSKLIFVGALPLSIALIEALFQEWGIGFVGEIIEKSKIDIVYIGGE